MGHSLDDILDVYDKRVIVRVPLNVPVEHGEVRDMYRLEACLPTVMFLTARGAKVVLLGHIGREGESLAPVCRSARYPYPVTVRRRTAHEPCGSCGNRINASGRGDHAAKRTQ